MKSVCAKVFIAGDGDDLVVWVIERSDVKYRLRGTSNSDARVEKW